MMQSTIHMELFMTRLMDTIGGSVRDRCKNANLTLIEDEIRKCILRFFARTGNPPTVQEITEIVAVPSRILSTRQSGNSGRQIS